VLDVINLHVPTDVLERVLVLKESVRVILDTEVMIVVFDMYFTVRVPRNRWNVRARTLLNLHFRDKSGQVMIVPLNHVKILLVEDEVLVEKMESVSVKMVSSARNASVVCVPRNVRFVEDVLKLMMVLLYVIVMRDIKVRVVPSAI
jgi:hypothetical protein